ncbi:hypothetical protein [Virgibacillus sp. JSM 102003]|uniref:hypothetical protein n=1 Tax=Virgibacillus sp. JSM 102003 TaxID=1562108 RepID=UPI0035BF3FCC
MVERKTYYVAVDTKDIREVSVPDSGIEYEIIASPDEAKEIQLLFTEESKDGRKATEYLGNPFDEWGADDKRRNYDDHLIKVYRRLYELGTNDTKSKINQLGLF